MAPEFVDRQLRLWSAMGGPQARFSVSAKWGHFAAYRGTDESAQTLEGLKFAALMGDLEDGPPHPETMAALAVLQQHRDRAKRTGQEQPPRTEILEHAWAAMEICRVGLKSIPKKHWRSR